MKKAIWPVAGEGIPAQYDTLFGGSMLMHSQYGTLALVIGIISAAISAALAVKWLVSYLQKHGLAVFGWYRIALGIVVGALFASGLLAV